MLSSIAGQRVIEVYRYYLSTRPDSTRVPDELRSPIKRHLVLPQVDPEQGIRHFNSLMSEQDLFRTVRLVRNWERIGTKGQELVEIHRDENAAGQALEAVARAKRRGIGICEFAEHPLRGTTTVLSLFLRPASGSVTEERTMSMVKVIELSSEPPESWEDATRQAVERASRTLRNIRSVWVKEFEAVVDGNNVSQFRVNLKVSFLLDETQGMQSGENVGG